MSVDEDARDADFSTSALALSCSPSSSSHPHPPPPPQKTNVNLQIYDLETRYLATANPAGTALKGYDGLLSSTGGAGGAGGGGGGGAGGRRPATVKAEERLFSRSSTTGQPPGSK